MVKLNKLFGVVAVATTSLVASPVFAADGDVATAIKDAIASGQTSYGAVTAGVVTVAALGFCVGMIVSWLRK